MNLFLSMRPSERRFMDLYLCYCGFEQCAPLYAYGPAVRPNYLIHFILRGKGIFLSGDGSAELAAGEGFLIEPEKQAFYQADTDEPWAYLWVGFGGLLAPSLVEQLGLGGEHLTFRSSRGQELKEIVFRMLDSPKNSVNYPYFVEGQLCLFFSELLKDIELKYLTKVSRENRYVSKALLFIQNHFHEQIQVKDIADYVGVNRSYLFTLFQKELNLGPREYLTMFRLSRAADLLVYTEDSIELVALSSGYRDPLIFSKAFKAQYGMTPSAYRRRDEVSSYK